MHSSTTTSLCWKDRIILAVTGASDGIGREAALTYARYSASVILLGRNDDKLRTVAQEIEREGWYSPLAGLPSTCSPVRPQACQQLAQQISMHYPRLDGVLHNAGLLAATSAQWKSRSRRSGSR